MTLYIKPFQINQAAAEIYCGIGVRLYNQGNHQEAALWFKKSFAPNTGSPDIYFEANFHLGAIARSAGKRQWRHYYKKGLERLLKKKEKSHLDLYRIGSTLKILDRDQEALPWFRKLVRAYPVLSLHAGAYFHLGEIYYRRDRVAESTDQFQRCLSLLPGHKKAGEYLELLKSKNKQTQ